LKSSQEKLLELDSLVLFKNLLKTNTKKRTRASFTQGNMVAFAYNAKDQTEIYDKSPLVIVLRTSKSYMLGLNFHWVPRPARKILVDYILKVNKHNIHKNLPLVITYKMLVPMIIKLKLIAVIRLYIKSRISARVMVIPYVYFKRAVYLPAENFSNGMSSDQLYRMAVLKSKSRKRNLRKIKK